MSTDTAVGGATDDEVDAAADLEAAAAAYEEARAAVEAVGEDALRRVAEAHDRATTILDRYADAATGTGDFEAYVELQGEIASLVENLPDDLPERAAFEAASDALDRRRLRQREIEAAREALEPAGDLAARLDDRSAARDRYVAAREAAVERREAVAERIGELERLARLADADLDAPVDDLRVPIEAHDDAVRTAFDDHVASAPARDVIDLLADAAATPLVPAERPPPDLRAYLDDATVGDEPLPALREYADYSRSKREHYVDDAAAFERTVVPDRSYLDRVDADPFVVGWPPPPAGVLWWQLRERLPLVARFAPGDVVDRTRQVRRLARTDRYGGLREAAVARDAITEAERDRIEAGVEGALTARRDERDRIDGALETHPPIGER